MPPLFIADRAGLNCAALLIADYGAGARGEAAARAVRSRDAGNIVHFCRWRQAERLISALAIKEAVGTLH